MILEKPLNFSDSQRQEWCFPYFKPSSTEEIEATAAAALNGQAAWSNAMDGATKVRDAYSRRSHELSQVGGEGPKTLTLPETNIAPEIGWLEY